MEFKFGLGDKEKIEVEIHRGWFTGRFYYLENGIKKKIRSALNPTTHFNITLIKKYSFVVGIKEKYAVEVTHIRPLICAGVRPHEFKIAVDGDVIHEVKSY